MSAFKPNYISTIEAARILALSRVGVLKRIQRRQIPAIKIGRSYAIPESFFKDHISSARSELHQAAAYVSVMEAAGILGVSRSAISKRIERGQLKARKVGRHYVIARSDIEEIQSHKTEAIHTAREYLSIPEYARLMNVSRIAIYKRVKNGMLEARRVGRGYVIAVDPQQESADRQWSVPELAHQMGVTRIAVFKQIRLGRIPAIKVGRKYVIADRDVREILEQRKLDKPESGPDT